MSGQPVAARAGSSYRVHVFGHESAVQLLTNACATGRIAQAVLLVGPPDVGKRSVARLVAQAILCEAVDSDIRPCGACRRCRLVRAGGAPDLHWLEPPLRVETVRDLQHDLSLMPSEAQMRVAVMPEIELASHSAANSLLKTLEEPPGHAIVLLTSADEDAVLPTIRSRCQRVPLRPLPTEAVAMALRSAWGADEERAAGLARLSGGRLGWAVRALDSDAVLADRGRWLDDLERALAASTAERMELADRLAGDREAASEGLASWTGWWRDVMLAGLERQDLVANQQRMAAILAAAQRYSTAEVVGCLTLIEDAQRRLAANANLQLTMAALMMELP